MAEGGGNCLVCGFGLDGGMTVRCPICFTPHHHDCWNYNGGCAVYGCHGKRAPYCQALVTGTSGRPLRTTLEILEEKLTRTDLYFKKLSELEFESVFVEVCSSEGLSPSVKQVEAGKISPLTQGARLVSSKLFEFVKCFLFFFLFWPIPLVLAGVVVESIRAGQFLWATFFAMFPMVISMTVLFEDKSRTVDKGGGASWQGITDWH